MTILMVILDVQVNLCLYHNDKHAIIFYFIPHLLSLKVVLLSFDSSDIFLTDAFLEYDEMMMYDFQFS